MQTQNTKSTILTGGLALALLAGFGILFNVNGDGISGFASGDEAGGCGGGSIGLECPAICATPTDCCGGFQCTEGQCQATCDGDYLVTNKDPADIDASYHASFTQVEMSQIEHCEEISGDLAVDYSNSRGNLEELASITSLGGTLTISQNDQLQSLAGLDNLMSVGGLVINANSSLIDIEALNNLEEVGGDLIVTNNPALTSLEGLDGLVSVGNNLEISGNDKLQQLVGLQNLETVGANCTVANNNALENIEELVGISSVGGDFNIDCNGALSAEDVKALHAQIDLDGIRGKLAINLDLNANECQVQTSH